MTENEKNAIKAAFYAENGFPGVFGCVDGTHIGIIAPKENEHLFLNRKGFHSLNAMIASLNIEHEIKNTNIF